MVYLVIFIVYYITSIFFSTILVIQLAFITEMMIHWSLAVYHYAFKYCLLGGRVRIFGTRQPQVGFYGLKNAFNSTEA